MQFSTKINKYVKNSKPVSSTYILCCWKTKQFSLHHIISADKKERFIKLKQEWAQKQHATKTLH